jgi:hypothetical protein
MLSGYPRGRADFPQFAKPALLGAPLMSALERCDSQE